MEFMEKGTLIDFMKSFGSGLDESLVRTFFSNIVSGVKTLACNNLAHRDLKP